MGGQQSNAHQSRCSRLQTNRNNLAKYELIRKQIIPFGIKSGLKKKNILVNYSFQTDTH